MQTVTRGSEVDMCKHTLQTKTGVPSAAVGDDETPLCFVVGFVVASKTCQQHLNLDMSLLVDIFSRPIMGRSKPWAHGLKPRKVQRGQRRACARGNAADGVTLQTRV